MKAVAVLGNSECVIGTIFFSQEGDGNMVIGFICASHVHFFSVLYLRLKLFQVQPRLRAMFLVSRLGFMDSMFMPWVTQPTAACQLVLLLTFRIFS